MRERKEVKREEVKWSENGSEVNKGGSDEVR